MTQRDIAALKERIAGRRVVASISGGKDSAAMSLHLRELGIEHDRVFMDTGWEHPVTYEYLRGDLTHALGPIVEISAARKMVDLVLKRGMFPSKARRFCTQELKIFPMQRYIAALVEDGEEVLNAVGIRKAESEARSKMAEWEWSDGFDCETWRPLIDWTEQDVIDIHTRNGLRPNPLYLRGAARVGCYPCIYARKAEIKLIAEQDPWRIDELRDLESKVGEAQMTRRVRRLKVLQEHGADAMTVVDRRALLDEDGNVKPYYQPSWFQSPLGRVGDTWSIDRVVEWSRTTRGGRIEDRQGELFSQADQGCMRWGLCETATDDDEAA